MSNQWLEQMKTIAGTCKDDKSLSYITEDSLKYEEDILKESEEEMLRLLDIIDSKNFIELMTFEQLTKFTFNKAHELINAMTISKRIKMLKDLDHSLLYAYSMTQEYNDRGFGRSLSPKVFLSLMGKIKHLEILQNWLYGIN